MGGGWDIGASLASGATSSASNNSPFVVTGGGGSQAQSFGNSSPISGTGTPSGVSAWMPWAIVGLVVIAFVAPMLMGKDKK
jgi:hypothetical protein